MIGVSKMSTLKFGEYEIMKAGCTSYCVQQGCLREQWRCWICVWSELRMDSV